MHKQLAQRCEQFGVRIGLAVLSLLLLASASGCTVIRNEWRTLISQPLKYATNIDFVRSKKSSKALGEQAWNTFIAYRPEHSDSPDYRDGFIEGFADFITYGGKGAPPLVPPRRYWKLSERTPGGHDAVQQWFAGFAMGASEAKLSGLRELATVSSSYWPTHRDDAYDESIEFIPRPTESLPTDEFPLPVLPSPNLPPPDAPQGPPLPNDPPTVIPAPELRSQYFPSQDLPMPPLPRLDRSETQLDGTRSSRRQRPSRRDQEQWSSGDSLPAYDVSGVRPATYQGAGTFNAKILDGMEIQRASRTGNRPGGAARNNAVGDSPPQGLSIERLPPIFEPTPGATPSFPQYDKQQGPPTIRTNTQQQRR